ncbi:unnamed protein product [Urochloa decumbens]|uniref:Uncharacterized protein n=1 Tax=Urochloa decumbens TaxID=240449 RepID=A0ABC9GYH0_9POAL
MDHTDRSEPSTAMAYSEPSRSGTTIVAVRNHHVLKIDGYSRTLNAHGARPRFRSRPFRAGGRTWHISYSPMGRPHHPDNTDSIALFLVLDDVVDEPVTAQATFSLLDQDGAPVPEYTFTTRMNDFSASYDRGFGYERFIRREDLGQSEYLKNDCFAVRVQVYMVKEAPSIAAVPPPDLRRDIGSLLISKEDVDVRFEVGDETFDAHRLVLGARSPVFMAELLGPMKEGAAAAAGAVRVDDMEPRVFEALLNFMYTDALPDEAEMEEEDACVMAQHLLVAADRYRIESLKSACEDRLRKHIGTDSAATILALAEQHCCPGLKEACFEFLGSPSAMLAVMETKEFEHLERSCPDVVEKIVSDISYRHLHKAKVSRWLTTTCNNLENQKA